VCGWRELGDKESGRESILDRVKGRSKKE
jgi:hypothetical protein